MKRVAIDFIILFDEANVTSLSLLRMLDRGRYEKRMHSCECTLLEILK